MHRKRKEYSKIIATISIVFWIFVNLYALIMMTITLDLSPVPYVIGSADAVVAIVLTSYYAKAKVENQIKLRKYYGDIARDVEKGLFPEGYETWGK